MVRWVKIQPDLAGRFAGEMDHAQSAGNQIPFANRFVDCNGGELRHLVRADDKASGAARPQQLDVPNVVTIGEDDILDRLHLVEARPVIFSGCWWIHEHRASIEPDRVTVQVPRPVGVSRTPREYAGKNFAHGAENVADAEETRQGRIVAIPDSIPSDPLQGLRDRTLIAVTLFHFARMSAKKRYSPSRFSYLCWNLTFVRQIGFEELSRYEQ